MASTVQIGTFARSGDERESNRDDAGLLKSG